MRVRVRVRVRVRARARAGVRVRVRVRVSPCVATIGPIAGICIVCMVIEMRPK